MLRKAPKSRRDNRNWYKFQRFLVYSGSLITFAALAAISGIIGNRSDAWFTNIWSNLMEKTVSIPLISLIATPLLSLLIIGSFIRYIKDGSDEIQKLSDNFLELDDSFCQLVQNLEPSHGTEEGVSKLLEWYWNKFRTILENVQFLIPRDNRCFIVIYRPDEHDSNYLTPWFKSRSAPDVSSQKFPISEEVFGQNRGIEGKAFRYRNKNDEDLYKTFVANLHRDAEGKWHSDDDDYRFCEGRDKPPLHRANVIAISLINQSTTPQSKLGVLCCYDIDEKTVSEDSFQKELLPMVSKRMSTAIVIAEKLSSIQQGVL